MQKLEHFANEITHHGKIELERSETEYDESDDQDDQLDDEGLEFPEGSGRP
jgi:hypothetical protein